MAKTPTHYDRLGVARNAPEEVIRGAYKALAQKNHPDKNINNPAATAIMQAINLAYDVLSDPQKRADYDARLGLEEMQEKTAARRPSSPHSSHAAYSSHTGRRPDIQPPPARSRGGFGPLFLFVILVAGFCAALYMSGTLRAPSFLRHEENAAAELAEDGPMEAEEAFVPKETSPQELAVCIFTAAKTYNVPPQLLLGLLSAEGGAVGKKTPAAGATEDLGLMQINSFWIPKLARTWKVSNNIALHRVRDDACMNVGVGAWILEGALDKSGDLRSGISIYHTSAHHLVVKTDNDSYVEKVIKLMELYKSVNRPEDLLDKTKKDQ